MIAPFLLD